MARAAIEFGLLDDLIKTGKTTLPIVERHVEHAPRGLKGEGANQGAPPIHGVNVGREAGPVSRTVTRGRSFFVRSSRDSVETEVVLGRWTDTRRSHKPGPRPRLDLYGRRSIAVDDGGLRVGWLFTQVSPPALSGL
jgi:hypothetical protein